MTHPGTLANLAPPTEATLMRRIEDIERVQRETGPALMAAIAPMFSEINAALSSAQAAIAQVEAQAAYQASLISRDAATGTFNTGTMLNDATQHFVGPQVVVSDLPIPTGKVKITISSSEASVSPGSNAVIAAICYAIDGVHTLDGSRYARIYTVGNLVGISLTRVGTETIPPGTYTIRAQAYYWSSGSSVASANFAGLRLLTEVIGSD